MIKEALTEALKVLKEKLDKAMKEGNYALMYYTAGQISIIQRIKDGMEKE